MTDLITKLYKTRINCSTYEPQIDSINTLITIRLIDFNNYGAANQTITITANKGSFVTSNIQTMIKQEAYIYFDNGAIIVYVNNIHPNQMVQGTIDIIQNGNRMIVTMNISGSDFVFDSSANGYIFYTAVPNATSNNIGTIKIEHIIDENNNLYLGVNDNTYNDIQTSKTVIRTTDSNGYIYLYYHASDWGFDTIQANNNNIMLYTQGWRTIQARENIEYTYSSTFDYNPFASVTIKYDNNIGVAQIIPYYEYWKTYTIGKDSAVVLLTFYSNEDNVNSKIPSYIFNSDYPYKSYIGAEAVFYITKDKKLYIRAYNDAATSFISFQLGSHQYGPLFYEKIYNYEEGV